MACRQAVVLLLLFPVVARIPVASAGQPSFDCAKASSWAEVTVCNDEGLSDLDRRLAELYRSNRAALTGEQQKNLIRNQRNWLRERESCAKRPDRSGCLVDAYKARIAQLGGEPESSPRDGAPASSANGGVTVTTVNGKTVWYGPSSKGTAFVEFQAETKGYTNTYILDCENKRFLWAKNVLRATGQDTGNSAGAEWKQLNPESTLSNAVYEAACPQLLASVRRKEGAPTEARDTKTANGDPWDHRSGLEEPEALAEPSRNVAPKVASSANVDNAAARVDIAGDKRSTGTGDEHTVPETQGIEVEPSKLVLPPARSTDVVDGGTPLAATGHMVTMPGGDAELQGAARRPDRISMKDGSMLSGNIGEGKIPFKSWLGEIEVRLEDVLAFADGKLHLADGTVLAGAFADGAIEIAASVGTLKVPAGEIVAIVREGEKESRGESTNRAAGDMQHRRGDLDRNMALKMLMERRPPFPITRGIDLLERVDFDWGSLITAHAKAKVECFKSGGFAAYEAKEIRFSPEYVQRYWLITPTEKMNALIVSREEVNSGSRDAHERVEVVIGQSEINEVTGITDAGFGQAIRIVEYTRRTTWNDLARCFERLEGGTRFNWEISDNERDRAYEASFQEYDDGWRLSD